MRSGWVGVAAVAAFALGAAAQENDRPAAARLFEARCAGCHVAPDPRVETDRAWLDQIRETA